MIRTISEIGSNGYWTGNARDIDDMDLCPLGWTRSPLPNLSHGEYAAWSGQSWAIVGPPPPTQPPNEISDRQFFQALAVQGMITQEEALAAVKTGDMPAAITGFIDQLPSDEQFGARMLLCGAVTFHRSHPLTDAFAAMYGMTQEQTDDLWRLAAGL